MPYNTLSYPKVGLYSAKAERRVSGGWVGWVGWVVVVCKVIFMSNQTYIELFWVVGWVVVWLVVLCVWVGGWKGGRLIGGVQSHFHVKPNLH